MKKTKIIDTISVTDHAVVRYFERVLQYDIEEIRKNILTEEIKKQYEILGNGTYPNRDNITRKKFHTVVSNLSVVTVIP